MKNEQKEKKITIMIAEDEPLLLQSLCKKITEADKDFIIIGTANNGKDLLNLINNNPPDAVISDIEMPICNGIELIQVLKELHPNIISIIVTSYDKFEYAQAAVKLQVKDYLLKPVVKEELTLLLSKVKSDIKKTAHVTKRSILELSEFGKNSISEAVELMHSYILENYTSDINLAKLSEQYHYNELHLSRSFKQVKGYTPSKLINELRLEDAKMVLRKNKKITVSELSEKLGFSSPMYFSRVFKYHTGMTPVEYRDLP